MTTFSEVKKGLPGNRAYRYVEVSRAGEPFGMLWTYAAKGEKHPWHAKPLDGDHITFWGKAGLKEAKEYMKGVA